MGFLDSISTVLERVVPTVIGTVTAGPLGGVQALAGVERAKKNEKIMERSQMNPFEMQSRNMRIQNQFDPQTNAGSPSFVTNLGQSLGNFGRDVGGFFQDISPLTSLFGGGGSLPRTNSGTATTIINQPPDESAMSGEILGANLGMGGALVSAARQAFRSPAGQTALGFGAGAIGSALMGDGDGKVRITRRMKSDVRKIYMMAGMNPNATAQILNNLGTYPRMNFDASLVFFILTKRFRNDGPVVTKAAVRKTKTTLRRMKGVVDMYNSVCKPTATRRRAAPSRAKAVQLISNK